MRKKTMMTMVGLLALPAVVLVAGVLMALASHRDVETGLVDGRLRPCPGTPNCVSSEAAEVEPLALEGELDAAFARLVETAASMPRARIHTLEPGYAHLVFTTPFLRFADDLELRLDRDLGVAQVRSASRIGHSDLGVNRARVEALRARWLAAPR